MRPYIRPVIGVYVVTPGLDELRAYRPYRQCGLERPSDLSGFRYAGLTCCVIALAGPSQSWVGNNSLGLTYVRLCFNSGGLIDGATAEQCPAHACHFVGQGNGGLVHAPLSAQAL